MLWCALLCCVLVTRDVTWRACQEHNKSAEDLTKEDLEECTFRPNITPWPGMESVAQMPVRPPGPPALKLLPPSHCVLSPKPHRCPPGPTHHFHSLPAPAR